MSLLMDALKKAEKKPSSSDTPKEKKEPHPPSSIEISNEEFSDFNSAPSINTETTSQLTDKMEKEALSLVLEEDAPPPLLEEEPVLTDVAAQRMLAATKKQHHNALKIKWLLGVLFIAMLLIVGGYYYYNDFIEPSTLSQVYPRRKPLLSTTNPAPAEPDKATVAAQPLSALSAPLPEDKIVTPLINVVKETAKSINANVSRPLPSVNQLPTLDTDLSEIETNNVTTEDSTVAIQTNGIKITRHSQTHSTQQINRAYQAFQSGKLKQAETLYKRILKNDQTSRDALLGLAAIAMHKGKLKLARQQYEKILKNYPRDTLAQTGVIATLTHTNMTALEGQLKLLASRSKKADYIYFNLGNLYARQQRWLLAQDAYYQAYSYNHKHATYLYNLAISLDKLGKSVPALQFYKQALKYAAQQPIRFNQAMVKQRIAELSATTSPSALSRLNATPQ